MKALRVSLVVASLVFLFAAGASANAIDPVIVVRGGSGSIDLNPPPGPITVAFPGQAGCTQGTYTVPGPLFGTTMMTCVFRNVTGVAFTNLVININSAQLPLTLQCPVICSSFQQTASGGIANFVFGVPIPSGPVPAGSNIDIEVAVDFVNFAQGTNFTLTPNVPEPATLVLFGTGAVAVWWKRRQVARG